MGFNRNVILTFKSHTTTWKYHGDMNAARFTTRLIRIFITNFLPSSVRK